MTATTEHPTRDELIQGAKGGVAQATLGVAALIEAYDQQAEEIARLTQWSVHALTALNQIERLCDDLAGHGTIRRVATWGKRGESAMGEEEPGGGE